MRLQAHQLTAYTDHQKSGRPMDEFVMPAPLPRKKRSQEESLMQRELIRWWHVNCRKFGVPEILLFSIPNGGWRPNPVTGSILKAEGLRRGVPDLMLAVPRTSFKPSDDGLRMMAISRPGLFLELKRREGVVSPEQEVFHQHLKSQGYKVEVVRSIFDAINIITTYITK